MIEVCQGFPCEPTGRPRTKIVEDRDEAIHQPVCALPLTHPAEGGKQGAGLRAILTTSSESERTRSPSSPMPEPSYREAATSR